MVSRVVDWSCSHCAEQLDPVEHPDDVIAVVICIACGTVQLQERTGFRLPKNVDEVLMCTATFIHALPLLGVMRRAYLSAKRRKTPNP